MEEWDVPSRRRAVVVVVAEVDEKILEEGVEVEDGVDQDCLLDGAFVGVSDSDPLHRFRWYGVVADSNDAADD